MSTRDTDDWPEPREPRWKEQERTWTKHDEAVQRCGKPQDGDACTLAGTEFCDWECPFR